jgi:hypothetical protein
MRRSIPEKSAEMFRKSYDVVVCGGGVAGVAAALAAARRGQRTALLEKTVYPGGLATAGLIYIYLPLCDGNGTQVTFGVAEELLLASIKYGPGWAGTDIVPPRAGAGVKPALPGEEPRRACRTGGAGFPPQRTACGSTPAPRAVVCPWLGATTRCSPIPCPRTGKVRESVGVGRQQETATKTA